MLHLAQAHELPPDVAPRVDHLHLGFAEQVVRVRVRARIRDRIRVTLTLSLTLALTLTLTLNHNPNPNHLGVAPQVAAHVVVLRRHLS